MKALKYGMALILGLGMLVCGAQAQASSKQSGDIEIRQESGLPYVPNAEEKVKPQPSQEQRGIPTPKNIEDLLMKEAYGQAVTEFEKFLAKSKTKSCDLTYLAYTFYDRLCWMDESNVSVYKQEKNRYINEFQEECGNTVEAYVMKNQEMELINWDSTVVWMTKAIEIEPSMGSLYTTRGSALWQLGQVNEACADFKKAMETDGAAAEMYNMQCKNLPQ